MRITTFSMGALRDNQENDRPSTLVLGGIGILGIAVIGIAVLAIILMADKEGREYLMETHTRYTALRQKMKKVKREAFLDTTRTKQFRAAKRDTKRDLEMIREGQQRSRSLRSFLEKRDVPAVHVDLASKLRGYGTTTAHVLEKLERKQRLTLKTVQAVGAELVQNIQDFQKSLTGNSSRVVRPPSPSMIISHAREAQRRLSDIQRTELYRSAPFSHKVLVTSKQQYVDAVIDAFESIKQAERRGRGVDVIQALRTLSADVKRINDEVQQQTRQYRDNSRVAELFDRISRFQTDIDNIYEAHNVTSATSTVGPVQSKEGP